MQVSFSLRDTVDNNSNFDTVMAADLSLNADTTNTADISNAPDATNFADTAAHTCPHVNTVSIQNRRYLGNKYKLVPFIRSIVDQHCTDVITVADIFSGTGAVANGFSDKKLITNDILYHNYLIHLAFFSGHPYRKKIICELIAWYNSIWPTTDNYMSTTFANTFFSSENCRKIGFIRQDIEIRYHNNDISTYERALLVTSLLYGADKIANTCGHYDAWRKDATAKTVALELALPQPDSRCGTGNECYNEDANSLAHRISADLVYIDPPYNSRQYCDTYHVLENIARWDQPNVRGVGRKMNRSGLKSRYCTTKATTSFAELIAAINARYILLSYNNMGDKGDSRSHARISDDDIMTILTHKGEVQIFTREYRPFSAGKSDVRQHHERLFLCTCH